VTDAAARDELIAYLLERLAERIGCDPSGIDRDADLIELGIRSIDAVLISGELEDRFGVEIEPVLLFECRTVNRVADSVSASLSRR
jgi:acyl carrier protein